MIAVAFGAAAHHDQESRLEPLLAGHQVDRAAVGEEIVERAIEAIEGSARTGKIGDGKIFVLPVEATVRIRTGERDEHAL